MEPPDPASKLPEIQRLPEQVAPRVYSGLSTHGNVPRSFSKKERERENYRLRRFNIYITLF